MAIVKDNIITEGLSGMIGGKLVFRQKGDQTIVSTRPVVTAAPSEQQLAQRSRFQEAVIYAKAQLADESAKAAYDEVGKKRDRSAYNVAVADFFRAPSIHSVDLSGYQGAKGDMIGVEVSDDFEVVEVSVEISNPDGAIVETGQAVHQGGNTWVFTADVDNEDMNGDRIVIRASDRPGNVAEAEETIPITEPLT